MTLSKMLEDLQRGKWEYKINKDKKCIMWSPMYGQVSAYGRTDAEAIEFAYQWALRREAGIPDGPDTDFDKWG